MRACSETQSQRTDHHKDDATDSHGSPSFVVIITLAVAANQLPLSRVRSPLGLSRRAMRAPFRSSVPLRLVVKHTKRLDDRVELGRDQHLPRREDCGPGRSPMLLHELRRELFRHTVRYVRGQVVHVHDRAQQRVIRDVVPVTPEVIDNLLDAQHVQLHDV